MCVCVAVIYIYNIMYVVTKKAAISLKWMFSVVRSSIERNKWLQSSGCIVSYVVYHVLLGEMLMLIYGQ